MGGDLFGPPFRFFLGGATAFLVGTSARFIIFLALPILILLLGKATCFDLGATLFKFRTPPLLVGETGAAARPWRRSRVDLTSRRPSPGTGP